MEPCPPFASPAGAEEARAEVVVGIGPISFDDLVAVARHGAPRPDQ